MYQQLYDLIKKYDKIIVQRHKNPDGDALGSQLGLYHAIQDTFSEKSVYKVGDSNYIKFLDDMDIIEDSVFEGALVIVCDVAVSGLVSDDRFRLADYVVVIDHHLNDTDFADLFIQRSDLIATAQIVSEFVYKYDFVVSAKTATLLLLGIVTDSGRFKYPRVDALTLKVAAKLIELGGDLQWIYQNLYVETSNLKKLKGYFINNFKHFNDKVIYMYNDTTVKKKYNVSTFTVSRGMVNQLADIDGVEVWANFTEDEDDGIICELRSKQHPIVEVAKQYGGGGHALACGCTVQSKEDVMNVLEDLNKVIESSD